MSENLTLKGFFYEVQLSGCQIITQERYKYGPYSDRYTVPEYIWRGQGKVTSRDTKGSTVFLFESNREDYKRDLGRKIEEYIFITDVCDRRPFLLEETKCKEAVIDYLARSIKSTIAEERKKRRGVIAEIGMPQIYAKALKKLGMM